MKARTRMLTMESPAFVNTRKTPASFSSHETSQDVSQSSRPLSRPGKKPFKLVLPVLEGLDPLTPEYMTKTVKYHALTLQRVSQQYGFHHAAVQHVTTPHSAMS